jgi:glucokinase
MAVIAIDLGGTKLASALFSANGTVIQRGLSQLERKGGRDVGSLIIRDARHLLRHAEAHGHQVEAIGICVPGISSSKTGRVWAPNIPGWEDYPLMDEMREAIRPGDIPVVIDNDRACSILGEVWQGSARGCTDAIFLAVGTGIGAGILTGGRILRGAHDIAGAIGWSALDRPFRSAYTWCGCFEYHASGEGLAKVAREYLAADPAYSGALSALERSAISTRDLFEAYALHDPVAERVLGEAIEFWGMATANLVSLFNPEKIVFGGGVFGPALQFLDAIMAEARKWAQPISINNVTLEGSRLGSDAALFGAAFRALQIRQEDSRKDSR